MPRLIISTHKIENALLPFWEIPNRSWYLYLDCVQFEQHILDGGVDLSSVITYIKQICNKSMQKFMENNF